MSENKTRKSSQARIDANKRYSEKTYKRFAVNVRKEKLEAIEKYKKQQGIESDSGIFNAAIAYCIENNIPLSGYADKK